MAVTSFWQFAGGPWQAIEMTNTAGNAYRTASSVPGQSQAGGKVEYYVSVSFSGFNADSPKASDTNSYTIAVRTFDSVYDSIEVTDDFAAAMELIADHLWQGVFTTNAGITDGEFAFSGVHTNTSLADWGETGRSAALPFQGTAAVSGGNITVLGTYTGRFAFVFDESTLDYTARQAMYHDFTGWDSATHDITSNNNWLAYNAAIRNDGDRKLRGNACYLSSNLLSFVQSPASPDGIGEISFWYRNYETNGLPATDCLIQLSSTGGTNESEWTTIAAVSNVVATSYSRFTTNLNTRYSRFVRILNQPTGIRSSICLDEILVTHAGAGVVMTNEATLPASPTTLEEVDLYVDASGVAGASNLALLAYYSPGTSGTFSAVGMTNAGGNTYVTTNRVPALTGDIRTAEFYFAATFDGFESEYASQPILYPAGGASTPRSYTALPPVTFTNLVLSPANPTILDETRAALRIEPFPSVTNLAAVLWYRGGTGGVYDSVAMVNTGNWTFVTQPDDIPRGTELVQFYVRVSYESVATAETSSSYYPANHDTDPLVYTNTALDYFEDDFESWAKFLTPGIYSNNNWIISCFRVDGSIQYIPQGGSLLAGWLHQYQISTNQWFRTPHLTNGVGTLRFWGKNKGSGNNYFRIERSDDGIAGWTPVTDYVLPSQAWTEYRCNVWSDDPAYLRVRKTGDNGLAYLGLDTFSITRPPAGVSITEVNLHPGYPNAESEVYVTCRIRGWEGAFFPAMNIGAQLYYKRPADPTYNVDRDDTRRRHFHLRGPDSRVTRPARWSSTTSAPPSTDTPACRRRPSARPSTRPARPTCPRAQPATTCRPPPAGHLHGQRIRRGIRPGRGNHQRPGHFRHVRCRRQPVARGARPAAGNQPLDDHLQRNRPVHRRGRDLLRDQHLGRQRTGPQRPPGRRRRGPGRTPDRRFGAIRRPDPGPLQPAHRFLPGAALRLHRFQRLGGRSRLLRGKLQHQPVQLGRDELQRLDSGRGIRLASHYRPGGFRALARHQLLLL